MNFALYIAKRYLRSKSSNNAINFISIIAAVGVILGAASLFIVLAGFAGLKDFTLQFSNIVDPDLKAEAASGKSFIINEDAIAKLDALQEIAFYSKVIEERVVISSENKSYLATIKGVDEKFNSVNNMDSVIVQGSWFAQGTNQTVIGWGISSYLSYGVLDFSRTANIYVVKPGKGQITSMQNAISTIKTVNVGIFNINETLDDQYIYAPIDMVQHLLNYEPNQISSIEFKLKESVDKKTAIAKIQSVLGNKVILKTKEQLNDAIYKMLNSENLFVYLLLTLISALLIFNVIGSIIMMILDKKKSLNTLFNLGVPINCIRNIFFIQGSVITLVGCTIGLVLGILIVFIQETFGIVPITASLAYPVSIRLDNLLLVFVTISVLGIVSSKIASIRITKKLIESY